MHRRSAPPHAEAVGAWSRQARQGAGVIANALPKRLRETADAEAVEVAAADRSAAQEGLRVLELIRHRLEVDRLEAAAIENGTRARQARHCPCRAARCPGRLRSVAADSRLGQARRV